MNKSIRKVSVALAVLFVALFVNLNFVQVVKGNTFRDHPDNARVVLNEHSSPRGSIVVNGLAIASSEQHTNGSERYLRKYADGPEWSAVTGFYSLDASASDFLGTSGIETADNAVLSGDDPKLFSTRLADLLTGRDPQGGSVELTLDRLAQATAYRQLDRDVNGLPLRGSVVAIDPTTGAIIAAVSAPSYDPNLFSPDNGPLVAHRYACLSDIDFPVQGTRESAGAYATRSAQSVRVQLVLRAGGTTELTAKTQGNASDYPLSGVVYASDGRGAQTVATVRYAQQFPDFGARGCSDVPGDPTKLFQSDPRADGPLLNRAFNQLYPPGSTFKSVVAATALEHGNKPSTSLIAPVSYYPADGRTGTTPCRTGDVSCVQNFDGEECNPSSDDATLAYGFAKSCNTLFSSLAIEQDLGPKIGAKAAEFGFGSDLAVPLPVAQSTVGSRADLTESGFLARTAFGQQDVRVTTLQGAMIASAVADDGKLMKPYLVSDEQAANLNVISKTEPAQLSQVLDPDVDDELKSMMEGVVTSSEGTGHEAAITDIAGVVVAGKTGTADTGRKLANGQDEPPDSWFIGYASRNGAPKIAIAVIVENGGNSDDETTGGANAAPIAQQVMEAYLKNQ